MTFTKQQWANYLSYAGAVPFLVATLLAIFNRHIPVSFHEIDRFIITYGAVIASFIAGIHWGVYLCRDAPCNLFLHSNIVALLAWLAVLLIMPWGAAILLLSFIYLLAVDCILSKEHAIEPWFMRLRIRISIIVVFFIMVHLAYGWFSSR